MAESYQAGVNSGAEAGHPAQKPNVTADQGITEKANERPDIATNPKSSNATDNTKADPNVAPNPNDVKADPNDPKNGGAASAQKKKDPEDAALYGEDEDVATKGDPNVDYPEQKHAGKVGYGPHYAETHGAVGMGERIGGLKQQIKGKLKRDPDMVEQGHEKMTGEAKKKELEAESQPDGAKTGKPNTTTEKKDTPAADAAGSGPQTAKGAEGDKPIAEAAKTDEPNKDKKPSVEKEAAAKSTEAKADVGEGNTTKNAESGAQPDDISHKPAKGEETTTAEKAEQKNESAPPVSTKPAPAPTSTSTQEEYKPNPPAPFGATGEQ